MAAIPGVPEPTGVFAEYPGATPKYAINNGRIDNDFRETMARLFLPIPGAQQGLTDFYKKFNKFEDKRLKKFEDERLSYLSRVIGGTTYASGGTSGGPGYVDFLLQNVQHGFQEHQQIVPLLSDDYAAYFFGQAPAQFSYSGTLLNTKQDDQAMNMLCLYREMLRGTKLAELNTLVHIRYSGLIVTGAISSLNFTMQAEMEMAVPFNFTLLVRQVTVLPNDEFGLVSDLAPFSDNAAEALRRSNGYVDGAKTEEASPNEESVTPATYPNPPPPEAPNLSDVTNFMNGKVAEPENLATTVTLGPLRVQLL